MLGSYQTIAVPGQGDKWYYIAQRVNTFIRMR
jgi:hypothetical protein